MKQAACRTDLGRLTKKLLEQQQIIERLTAERDKLQREICDWVSLSYEQAPQEVARRYGWDCFKEKSP